MKKLNLIFATIVMCLVGMSFLHADGNSIEIVSSPKQYNILNSNNETIATLKQEVLLSESDLVSGSLTIQATFTSLKSNLTQTKITLPITNEVTNNFNVSLISGNNITIEDDNTIVWDIGNIAVNESISFKYSLTLTATTSDIVEENILVNNAPTIQFDSNGDNLPETAFDSTSQCSIAIKVLKTTTVVDNPQTGVVNYIIMGSMMLAVGAITYIIASKKSTTSI